MKQRRRPPGWMSVRGVEYWSAIRACKQPAAKAYRPRTARLTQATPEEREARCHALTAELLEWLALENKAPAPHRAFDGTIASLARIYETHPNSPFRAVCHATQMTYSGEHALLVKAVGDRRIDRITGADLRRWHASFAKPKKAGGPERLRRAQGCMKALRRITSWGVQLRLPGCADLRLILRESRFAVPPARERAPTYDQVVALIAAAHEIGRPSIAMAAALMFDTSLRQTDVIGKWEPTSRPGIEAGGCVHRGRRWGGGLVWQDIKNGELTKRTTKTGALFQVRVADFPLLLAEIAKVPEGRRIGPMVVDEQTGRPYRHRWFAAIWRRAARKAGIPDDVWSRDTRAGAITEAFDAGAELEHVRQLATHTDPKVTGRYNRGSVKQTSTVAALRNRHRRESETK